MFALDALSRMVHVSTAIALVGGSLFMLLVLMPAAARSLNEEAHQTLRAAVTSRWKWFVHIGIVLFLLSGFYNYIRAMPIHDGDSLYHALVGTKILIALVVFFLAAALVGKSPKLESIRQRRPTYLSILVLLAAIIVAISGYVKVRGSINAETTPTSIEFSPVEAQMVVGSSLSSALSQLE